MTRNNRDQTKKERRSSHETVLDNLENSIKRTKFVIISSLQSLTSSGELCIDFITKERLARPPFPFMHALIVIYNQHLSFAKGLYTEFDLELKNVSTRQERIKFLFKIFVCVAMITRVRVDIYVSPAKLLGGQEVTASHLFLRCLAKASKVPSEQSAQVAEEILKIGESALYKQSVKSRNMIVRIQAIIRGKLTRIGWYESSTTKKEVTCTTPITEGKKSSFQKVENRSLKKVEKLNTNKTNVVNVKRREPSAIVNDTSEQLRKGRFLKDGKVDDKCAPCEACINELEGGVSNIMVDEDGKCHIRPGANERNVKQKIWHVDEDGRNLEDCAQHNYEDEFEKTYQNEHRFKTKVVKKFVIKNGVVTQQTKEVNEVVEDRNEEDTDARLKVISQREVEISKKLDRLKDREAKLKIRLEEAKQKEIHLQLYEDRVKRLADNLRKQQDKMKEDEAQRALELDELRLQTTSNSCRMPNRTNKGITSLPNEFHFSDELLRQACYNPTITDLRLGLERKERQLKSKYANLLRAEKDLQSRIIEFERNCASQETQSAENELPNAENKMHPVSREKLKRKVKKRLEENMSPESSIPGGSSMPDNSINRRDAFVPATVPNELKARTSAPKKSKEVSDQSTVSKHVMTTMSSNSMPSLNASDEKKNIQLNRRQSLPRSLIEYTNSHV